MFTLRMGRSNGVAVGAEFANLPTVAGRERLTNLP